MNQRTLWVRPVPGWLGRAAVLVGLSALSPAALAGDADWSGVGYLLMGGVAGALVALGLWGWLLARSTPGSGWSTAGRMLAGLAVVPLGAVVGAGLAIGVAEAQKSAQHRSYGQRETKFRESPLQQTACSAQAEVDTVQLQTLAQAEPVDLLVRVLLQCTLWTDAAQAPIRQARFETLASVLARRLPDLSGPDTPAPWCDVLRVIHQDALVDRLRVLHRMRLPLACREKGGESWGLATRENSAVSPEHEARALAFYTLALEAGAPLGRVAPTDGRHLLHRVVRGAEPRLVLLALRAGADPALADPSNLWTPRVHWVLRRHEGADSIRSLQRWTDPANREAVDEITHLMGQPTPQEVNAGYEGNGQSPLWAVLGYSGRPFATAQLRELLALGARPDHRDWHGYTFLQGAQVLDEATLALLVQQPPEVLHAMGQVQPTSYVAQPVPLVQAARARGDEPLVGLLCQHGAVGC